MLQDDHKFTIILPSCLDRPQGASVFPLSSLLQKDKLYVTDEDTRTNLRSRQAALHVPGAILQIPRLGRMVSMEHRRSHKLGRTCSVTKTLNGGLGMTRQIDFQDLSLQLVQVHVIDRVLGILWRAERNEGESTMFGTWQATGSV